MTLVITGSNKGIGFQIARLLAKNGYGSTIIITSRNMDLGNSALEKLRGEFPTAKFDLVQLDVTKAASRNNALETLKTKYGMIDILINNSGVMHPADSFNILKQVTGEEKAEMATAEELKVPLHEQAKFTFDVNYFGLKAFTESALPLIKSRLINVASTLSMVAFKGCNERVRNFFLKMSEHSVDELNALVDDFLAQTKTGNGGEEYSPSPYCMSKACVRALTYKQAEMYKDIVVLQGCPGWCDTDLLAGTAPYTPEQGADLFYWLATTDEPEVLGSKGGFYFQKKLGKFDDDFGL